ncbi:MAG: O-antigen ligase family protein, partial [Candidatus Limnocylindria bacterium]
DVAVGIGVVAHFIVSWFSLDPESSLEMSGAVLAYAATFWAARRIALDERIRRVTALAITAALCFWLVIIAITWIGEKVTFVQLFGWPPVLDAQQPYVWGSVNTPPVLAMLAGAFIAWLPSGRGRIVLIALVLATAVVIVPLSVGRAGWLGIGVAVVSLEVLLGGPVTRRLRAAAGRGKARARAAVGISAVVIGAALIVGLSRGGDLLASALDSRIRLWQQALELFASDPLTGAGPSTFGWARLVHVPDYVDRVGAKDVHSMPLQTLSDGGTIMALAFAAVLIAWVTMVVERRILLTIPQRISIAVLIGYGAFALLDDLSFLPAVTVLLIMLAAWSIPRDPKPDASGERPAFAIRALVLTGVLVAGPAVLAMSGSRLDAEGGRIAAVEGEWSTALTYFERSAEQNPSNAQHWMSVGLAAAFANDPERATVAYERARSISPGDPAPWGALAALAAGRDEEIELLDQAVRRSNDARYAFRLGEALELAGDDDGAARALAIGAALQPDWVAAVPLELQPAVVRALPAAIGRVGSVAGHEPNEARWNAGLLTRDLPSDAPAAWRAVAAARDGDEPGAAKLLDQARQDEPTSGRADQAAAAIAFLACDQAAYARAAVRVEARRLAPAERGHPVRVRRPGVYRLPELGDYQPVIEVAVPEVPLWPFGLIEVPDCGW